MPGDANVFVMLVLFVMLLTAAICDLQTGRIPNYLSLGGIVAGLVCRGLFREVFAGDPCGSLCAVGALLSGTFGILLPVLILFPVFVRKGIGAGDIKLFAAVGSFLGPERLLYHMLYSCAAGALWGGVIWGVRIIRGRNNRRCVQGESVRGIKERLSEESEKRLEIPFAAAMFVGYLVLLGEIVLRKWGI